MSKKEKENRKYLWFNERREVDFNLQKKRSSLLKGFVCVYRTRVIVPLLFVSGDSNQKQPCIKTTHRSAAMVACCHIIFHHDDCEVNSRNTAFTLQNDLPEMYAYMYLIAGRHRVAKFVNLFNNLCWHPRSTDSVAPFKWIWGLCFFTLGSSRPERGLKGN